MWKENDKNVESVTRKSQKKLIPRISFWKSSYTASVGGMYTPKNRFPTSEQMALVWASPKRLQTLHSAHILTLVEEVKRNRLEASAVLRPVKELIIIGERI